MCVCDAKTLLPLVVDVSTWRRNLQWFVFAQIHKQYYQLTRTSRDEMYFEKDMKPPSSTSYPVLWRNVSIKCSYMLTVQ